MLMKVLFGWSFGFLVIASVIPLILVKDLNFPKELMTNL